MPEDESERLWQPGAVVVFRFVETPLTARIVHAYMGDPASVWGSPFLVGGEIITVAARPYIVISDAPEALVLYQPENTPLLRWHQAERKYFEEDRRTRGASLRVLLPGKGYDVTLFFRTGETPPWHYEALYGAEGLRAGWRQSRDAMREALPPNPSGLDIDGRFVGWYVNMQMPFIRRSYGIDVADMALDIVVRPDHSWYWKDEDELEMAVAAGACSPEEAAGIREAGLDALRRLEAREAPFTDEWTRWQPERPVSIARENIPDGWQELPALIS